MKKKILMLNYEFPPLGGGGGVISYDLARGFVRFGYQVDIITSYYKGLKKFEKINGINVYRVRIFNRQNQSTATMISMFSYVVFGFFKGLALCQKNQYDFIHTAFVIPTGPLGYVLSKIFKVKNILTIIGGDIYDPTKKSAPHRHWYWRFLIRFIINGFYQVVAISSNTRDNALKYYNPIKNIKIIPLAYSPYLFKKVKKGKLGLSNEKKYLISVGRLIKRKGFDDFIRALALLDNNICGLIIGQGSEKDNLIFLAEKLQISKRIKFLGFLPEEKKFQYLTHADIYILSSIHEGFGIVLQEAMQVGLPVVATNYGGQTDFIEDNKNGLLVEAKNFEQLAIAIKYLLNNKELMSKMSKQNLKDLERFNLDDIAKKYIGLVS